MKSLRKSILTLLALTLFGGAGAWAQGPTQVTQFTTDMLPASWATDNSALTLADMQALGFVAVDESVAAAWTGAPSGEARLFYTFNNGEFRYVFYDNGSPVYGGDFIAMKADFYHDVTQYQYFYTGGGAQEIELTKEGANQWTLGQTPDYDLELQVEYYEAHALKNIPAGWTVMVNDIDKTAAIDGDSLMIVETDNVTLIPDNPRRVKSVTLEDPAVLVTIDGITLDITGCTTWADIIARNHGVIWVFGSNMVESSEGVLLTGSSDEVHTSDPYDPAQQSDYYWGS